MEKEEKVEGAYITRMNFANSIREKLVNRVALTEEEIDYVCGVINDPLEEFCVREGTYRLVEMHNLSAEEANSLEDAAAEVVRDTIDYSETLYDDIDRDLESLICENSDGKAEA